jgi:hypothetical protein
LGSATVALIVAPHRCRGCRLSWVSTNGGFLADRNTHDVGKRSSHFSATANFYHEGMQKYFHFEEKPEIQIFFFFFFL